MPNAPDSDVMVRRIGESRDEAIPLSEIRRRREEQAKRQEHDYSVLALKLGATVTLAADRSEMWWFVLDVNAHERNVSVTTLMFDRPRSGTFRFELVNPAPASDVTDEIEANYYRRRLGLAEWSGFEVDEEGFLRAA